MGYPRPGFRSTSANDHEATAIRAAFAEYFREPGNLIRVVEPSGEVRTLVALEHWPGPLTLVGRRSRDLLQRMGRTGGNRPRRGRPGRRASGPHALPGSAISMTCPRPANLLIGSMLMNFTTSVFVAVTTSSAT